MHTQRIKKIQTHITKENTKFFLITNASSIFYLTGFRGLDDGERESSLLVSSKQAVLFTSKMYKQEAAKLPKNLPLSTIIVDSWKQMHSYLVEKVGIQKLAIEKEDLYYREYKKLHSLGLKLDDTSQIVEDLRSIKDKNELQYIKKAAKIADEAIMSITNKDLSGLTEIQVSRMIKTSMEDMGAQSLAFEPIVAAGKNSSMPHHKATKTKIGNGPLVIDLGAKYQGYCSDITRTVFVGKATRRFDELYELVRTCLLSVMEKIDQDLSQGQYKQISSYDKLARKLLGNYSKYFAHSLGHGVGIDIHEQPHISSTASAKLVPGMVITLEPGIYIEDWGGIRLEQLCHVGSKKLSILSKADL